MVTIDMTLTTPNCPSAAELPGQVENAVEGVSGVREAKVSGIRRGTPAACRTNILLRCAVNPSALDYTKLVQVFELLQIAADALPHTERRAEDEIWPLPGRDHK
jgi:hypothetical protein